MVVSKMEITTSTSEDSSVVQQEGSRWVNKSDSVSKESSVTVNSCEWLSDFDKEIKKLQEK